MMEKMGYKKGLGLGKDNSGRRYFDLMDKPARIRTSVSRSRSRSRSTSRGRRRSRSPRKETAAPEVKNPEGVEFKESLIKVSELRHGDKLPGLGEATVRLKDYHRDNKYPDRFVQNPGIGMHAMDRCDRCGQIGHLGKHCPTLAQSERHCRLCDKKGCNGRYECPVFRRGRSYSRSYSRSRSSSRD